METKEIIGQEVRAAENDKWRAHLENAKEPLMYWPFSKAWWKTRAE